MFRDIPKERKKLGLKSTSRPAPPSQSSGANGEPAPPRPVRKDKPGKGAPARPPRRDKGEGASSGDAVPDFEPSQGNREEREDLDYVQHNPREPVGSREASGASSASAGSRYLSDASPVVANYGEPYKVVVEDEAKDLYEDITKTTDPSTSGDNGAYEGVEETATASKTEPPAKPAPVAPGKVVPYKPPPGFAALTNEHQLEVMKMMKDGEPESKIFERVKELKVSLAFIVFFSSRVTF